MNYHYKDLITNAYFVSTLILTDNVEVMSEEAWEVEIAALQPAIEIEQAALAPDYQTPEDTLAEEE